jgi:hypothetical protein
MNERIDHCLYLAGLTASGCWEDLDTYTQEGIERFAEFIVLECAKHALVFNHTIQSLEDKVMRDNLDRVQDYIKDRMGVEE